VKQPAHHAPAAGFSMVSAADAGRRSNPGCAKNIATKMATNRSDRQENSCRTACVGAGLALITAQQSDFGRSGPLSVEDAIASDLSQNPACRANCRRLQFALTLFRLI
jgi:hypothetical protein